MTTSYFEVFFGFKMFFFKKINMSNACDIRIMKTHSYKNNPKFMFISRF